MTHDLVIRNGFVIDGSGSPGREGDVAIDDGKITAVGKVAGKGREEIDAKGEIVTPGFVDVHTHYDGQVTWGDALTPSSIHGVTTAIMGNCGVGFAPCRDEDHDRLIRLMEGVEDIPFPVLSTGLPWNWESFPDYLDSLSGKQFDIDFGAQLPHAALRVFVMGERGANREEATPQDIEAMAKLAREAVEAGALGFSTSRTLNHRTSDGQPTPTLTASEEELTSIGMALKEAGKGVLQFVSDFDDPKKEAAMLRRIVEATGRPLSVSLAQSDVAPEGWRILLGAIEDAVEDGLPMRAQVCGRPVGVLLGLDLTMNPFIAHPVYQEIKDKTLQEKVAALRDPDFRARLLASKPDPANPFVKSLLRNFGKLFTLDAVPDYEPDADRTVEAIAKARGITNEEAALDILLEDDGRGMLYLPFLNYANGSLDPSYEMLKSPATIPGLSDGGAHVGMICDGSFPTSMLTHWTRDRSRGPKFPLEWIVKRQTADTAHWIGLHDRGLIAPGYRADLNIIDYDGLTLHRPVILRDLPANGRRLMQRASGYTATIVAGQIIYRDGDPTGAKPGRLVRGAQGVPAHAKIAAE
ncbi:MAG: amidohydrolase [Henriciella sp.]|jgi:N-acyl-D-aspartate/D-glutamate deacylase|uniref:N-acyl-D-amino-acid deacylase family protein n=1 Tax=Henriciella sp. TaxID=1968823 RepID=UPI000C0F9809|nr:amidohydrolase family protein [Henriciella sp.]MAN73989.1 amidohydrolase [Henriciella sp.]MBF34610.1 amidohydrolase [Hyphomonadaceae bacterium]PHR69284.1 MAG: amidohydrolase [Henriciella sp.]|tara:strand:+ start:1194 stop:2933 length:1740 start_codon:yes stop_codon:yes gene_type:complete